ncbi:Uncharacterized protein APZ42_018135 [Daphnia magna]|uniref:Uncharacterized protein n=1 Tax=Daphnia magna TaxID=35525 RepID=A0A164ZCS1_9CRUS|nr:Uncharacterized protein APZ42_018135 [Daphnia magna]
MGLPKMTTFPLRLIENFVPTVRAPSPLPVPAAIWSSGSNLSVFASTVHLCSPQHHKTTSTLNKIGHNMTLIVKKLTP